MAKFRKKPVVIEAVQLLWTTWDEMCKHADVGKFEDGKSEGCFVDKDGNITKNGNDRIGLRIPTLEGTMLAVEGDWVIRGIKGELYPCKPDIFAATYEPADG